MTYGIYFTNTKRWLVDDSGMIFHTQSLNVANEQLKLFAENNETLFCVVKTF